MYVMQITKSKNVIVFLLRRTCVNVFDFERIVRELGLFYVQFEKRF